MTILIPWDGPERWQILAKYNGEVSRGIVHTEEWKAKMAELQQQFNAEQEAKYLMEGYQRIGDGWMRLEPVRRRRWWWPW